MAKKRKLTQQNIVDEDGVIERKGIWAEAKKRYRNEPFTHVFQHSFELLASPNIDKNSLQVLVYILLKVDYENKIQIKQSEICKMFNADKSNISKTIKAFCEMDILRKVENKTYIVNPILLYKGQVNNRVLSIFDGHWKREFHFIDKTEEKLA